MPNTFFTLKAKVESLLNPSWKYVLSYNEFSPVGSVPARKRWRERSTLKVCMKLVTGTNSSSTMVSIGMAVLSRRAFLRATGSCVSSSLVTSR